MNMGFNFAGGMFNQQKMPALGQFGNLFPVKESALDPKLSPFAYGQAPQMTPNQIAGLSDADMSAIGQMGSGMPQGGGMDFGNLAQGLLAGGGAMGGEQKTPPPQDMSYGRQSTGLDPRHLMQKYGRGARMTQGLLG